MFRFLLKNKYIKNNNVIAFNPEQSKQIRKVLRMRPGDRVEVFDNKGWLYTVELTKVTDDLCLGKIVGRELFTKSTNIVLFQALPKNPKAELIIQKSVELGVDRIVFFESEFSVVKANSISKQKINRWNKIAEEAAEQSGRVFVPEIVVETTGLEGVIKAYVCKEAESFILDMGGEKLGQISISGKNNVNFFVGPEGGFSKRELLIAKRHSLQKVRVGLNMLRTETAALAFLSQLYLFLDFSS